MRIASVPGLCIRFTFRISPLNISCDEAIPVNTHMI